MVAQVAQAPFPRPSGIPPGFSPSQHELMKRASCAYYAQDMLRGPVEEPYCGRFVIADHHMEWDSLIHRGDRICVLSARDHGKSQFWSFAFPIWKADTEPGTRIFIFSATKDQATRILGFIKDEIEENPKLAHLRPKNVQTWNMTSVRLGNGSRIFARGFGTKTRGAHPKYVICDDVLNDEDATSEVTRKKHREYFFTAVSNMVVPGGMIVIVGCVTKDTYVTTRDGLRRIGDLNPDQTAPAQTMQPLGLPVYGRDGVRVASHYWVNGRCPTKRISLRRGYDLEGSHRHPVLVMGRDGVPSWRRLPELSVGDYVGVQAGQLAFGPDIDLREFKSRVRTAARTRNQLVLPDVVTPDLAYLIGLWTAEGSYEANGRVMISNTEPEIRARLAAHPFGLQFKESKTPGSEQTMRASSKDFLELIEFLGGRLARCDGKKIPERLMAAPMPVVRAYLRGLFDGDGCANKSTSSTVTLGTTSGELAKQVQQLLLNFGIVSTRRQRPVPRPTARAIGRLPLWTVTMSAHEANLFGKYIGFGLPRKQRVCDLFQGFDPWDARGVPHQGALISRIRTEKPRIPRNTRAPFRGNIAAIAAGRAPAYRSLAAVLEWFEAHGAVGPATTALRKNLEERLIWLPVRKIEDGEADTVDFVVPEGHSFISNGIVSHNTPFHQMDLYGELSENKRYVYRKFPAISSAGKALWPMRYDVKHLQMKRDEVGPVRFTREFLCCHPDTVIETARGPVPIVQVNEGDRVLTHTGAWRKVLRTMSSQFDGELVRVKQLRVTPGHPVFTQDGFVPAELIQATDLTTYPRPQVLHKHDGVVSFAQGASVPFLRTRDGRIYARGSAKHLKSGSHGKSGAKSIPESVALTAPLMRTLGMWLAEGHVGKQGQVVFSFAADELHTLAAEVVRTLGTVFGVAARVDFHPERGLTSVCAHNKLLADWFARTFGKGAGNKRVPLWMRDLPEDLVWALVLGYADGDGHVDAEGTARISSIAPDLLRDVQYMLARCGIVSILRKAAEARPNIIQGRHCWSKASWVLSISGGGYDAFVARERPSRTFQWSRVHTSLGRIPYSGLVYNLEVQGDNSYVADGVAVHNCEPISDDMSIFPERLFRGQPTEQFQAKLGLSMEFWRKVGIVSTFIGVDVAISAETGADYFVIFVIGLDKDRNRWVLDIVREKGLSYQDQLSRINEAGRKYDADLIFIEANQMQRVWGDELIRTTDLPIKKFVTTGAGKTLVKNPTGNTYLSNKNSLEGGVPALRVALENRKYRIPRGDEHSVEMTNIWINEMKSFTMLDGKLQGVGSKDDTVMANWIAERAVAAGGFSFSTGNEKAEMTVEEFIKQQTATPSDEAAGKKLAAQVKRDVQELHQSVTETKSWEAEAKRIKEARALEDKKAEEAASPTISSFFESPDEVLSGKDAPVMHWKAPRRG